MTRTHSIPSELSENTVWRLNTVIQMLSHHDCHEDDTSDDSSGGFDLAVCRETLEGVRDLHLAAMAKAAKAGA